MHFKFKSTFHLIRCYSRFFSEQERISCRFYANNYFRESESGFKSKTRIFSQSSYSHLHKMGEPTIGKTTHESIFRISDYDCIGFDLDNTICMYKLTEMVKLEYEVLSKYLVTEKGYDADYLLKPLDSNLDFLQKGLVLDFFQGNIMQLRSDGCIQRASHGTRFMTDEEIKEIYGPDKKWNISVEFCQNMLDAWNGPLSERIRTVSDYFDMPAALAFGRIIDSLDAKEGSKLDVYNVWPDILDALVFMFRREHFMSNEGGYFTALKANPEQYIKKCSNNVINWLKQIKSSKIVFLLTGSHVDFASFTASYSLGEDWKKLFDIVLCYARKPGFFTGGRPFIKVDGITEMDPIASETLEFRNVYTQGNWQDLYHLISRKTGRKHPRCLYVGDNLIQDIFVPSEYTKCDTVAVIEELGAEGMAVKHDYFHMDAPVIISNGWGSYFGTRENKSFEDTLWGGIIKKHCKICVPDLDTLANLPLTFEFHTFSQMKDKPDVLGYYPGCPLSLSVDPI